MKERWRKFLIPGLVGGILVFTAMAHAGHDEIQRISIQELKTLMDQGADIVIYDAQVRDVYAKGHIKGAASLPWKQELEASDIRLLPKSKDAFIVTYCDCGPGETDSSDLAAQLTGLGYTNVKILGDPSIRGWKKSGYPLEKGCSETKCPEP